MKLVQSNPYRTLGLLVGASAREKERQVKRLKQYIEAEQEPEDDFSFPALQNLHRTVDSITEAASKLNLDNDRMSAALFWFYKGNEITDEPAFENLKQGNINDALQIWEKLIIDTKEDGSRVWKSVTSKNCSAYHNYFVAAFLSNANANTATAIMANLRFLESDFIQDFKAISTDDTYKTTKKELQLLFLKQLESEFEANGKSKTLIELLKKQQFSAKDEFLKDSLQKPIEYIEQKIEATKAKRKADKTHASNFGKELHDSCKNELTHLKNILGENDIKYSTIADKVANEILQCSIDSFNENQENDSSHDYLASSMKLAKTAATIAVGNLTKERIKDSISTLEEMKDRELSQAIELLQSVKDAYENNERNIRIQVREQEASLSYGQSINWSKVNDLIRNSIDWNKVAELIQQVISTHNVEKIRNIDNPTKLSEYKSLVNFILDKMSYPAISKVKYISWWETVRASATSYSPTTSSSSEEGFPTWLKWVIAIIIFIVLVKACD